MATTKETRIKIPYLVNPVIVEKVNEILDSTGWDGRSAVDIESIVEKHFKLTVFPLEKLKYQEGVDAYVTSSSTIMVDKTQYDENSGRYRFSLAHELAHFLLHLDAYKQLGADDIKFHIKVQNEIPDEVIKEIERQAYRFAGCLLMPKRAFEPMIKEYFSQDKLNKMTITEISNSIEAISKQFNVSTEAVQKQLMHFYPTEYKAILKASKY